MKAHGFAQKGPMLAMDPAPLFKGLWIDNETLETTYHILFTLSSKNEATI